MNVFGGVLELAFLSIRFSVCLCVGLCTNTSFFQSAGRGIKSLSVTALILSHRNFVDNFSIGSNEFDCVEQGRTIHVFLQIS